MIKILYIIIIIIIILLIMIKFNDIFYNINECKKIDLYNNFILKRFYTNILDLYPDDKEYDLYTESFIYKYKTVTNTFKYNQEIEILKNILSKLTLNTIDDSYIIPLNLCTSIYLLKPNIDTEYLRNIFILFLNKITENDIFTLDTYFKLYSRCAIYIIMYRLNNCYNLEIDFDENEYNNCLNIFNKNPIIISCKSINNIPGFYSDGSYVYDNPPKPGSVIEGSAIFDILLFAKYILKIPINNVLIDSYYRILTNEICFNSIYYETTGNKFIYGSFISYFTQIMFQLTYYYPETTRLYNIINVYNNNNIKYYNESLYNLNIYPSIDWKVYDNIDNYIKYTINTVNGNMRISNTRNYISSFNYSSFCYVNDIKNKNTYLRYGIKNNININFYTQLNNLNLPLVGIQNLITIENNSLKIIEISPYGSDHASVAYILNDNELFVGKRMITTKYMICSYEILSFNSIISVNHITNITESFTDFIIFISNLATVNRIDENTVITLSYTLRCNKDIDVTTIGEMNFFTTKILNFEDTVITFSINRDISNLITRPDDNTICSGFMEIKEKRENEYMNEYDIIPNDFDPLGYRYFEMSIYNLKLGFVLYGPFENVARYIDNKEVIVEESGVRYIIL
ncbi:unknown similar to AMEV195 [Adoxophyes honmai entomopoxvirus 'L']|uniref:Uncharacterized protein n=1 Tax=Adoxophyes honmai entomopoxvirus 'L' TaxID=1293540 RepID=A0A916KPC5_9POXV|nr:unknown similar to AMEV195 [Adoxophyes honmai entomopoxvirus 'L']CCU55553.1 unknown similar to AMEV195 [Adoxophyes honmai entomopoxvirus 'L']